MRMARVTNRIRSTEFFVAFRVGVLLLCLLSSARLYAEKSNEQVFTRMYQHKIWGTNTEGEGSSGGGSTLQATEIYRQFLQDFFELYQIRSVVDLGCGDWEFSKAICWDGIDYRGYDVVASVILKNRAYFQKENIQFFHADAISSDLPSADLLICKDVLQHLPNKDIAHIVKQFGKYKYCLITNDVDPSTLSSKNSRIPRGGSRTVDLTQPPFLLRATKILTYEAYPNVKQVLLIQMETM